jgi:hypothetical protein
VLVRVLRRIRRLSAGPGGNDGDRCVPTNYVVDNSVEVANCDGFVSVDISDTQIPVTFDANNIRFEQGGFPAFGPPTKTYFVLEVEVAPEPSTYGLMGGGLLIARVDKDTLISIVFSRGGQPLGCGGLPGRLAT